MPMEWLSQLENPVLRVLLAAAVAVLFFGLLARLGVRLLKRLTRPFLFPRELTRKAAAPIQLLVPLLALQAVWTGAPDDLPFIEVLRHATLLLIIASLTWLGLRAVSAVQQVVVILNPVDISDNLRARRIQTQTRVLVRTLGVLVIIFGLSSMLMTFPSARQFGASLLASAGLAGLAVGFAARPVLGNLIAGLQIAITQPIRLDDVVIVEGEWGRIEEITGTYVVVRIWDSRRLVVPLTYFIENPFQNWTRHSASLLGSVFFCVDYSLPLEPLRREMERLCREEPGLWDGEVCVLQVTDCNERAMQLRVLASSGDSSRNWDLRCYLRENLLAFINHNYPGSLPRMRANLETRAQVSDEQPHGSAGGFTDRQPPV